jgi:competence transcription factor ComK
MCLEEVGILKKHKGFAIAPRFDGMHSSMIHTDQGSLFSKEPVQKIIEQYCLEYGSTLDGRLQASREKLGYIKNPPILISESLSRVALQAPCYQTKGTIWLLDLDFKIVKCEAHTEVIFNNGIKFEIDLSVEAMTNRKLKTFNLLFRFKS